MYNIWFDMLIFLDETHFNDRTADREYGYALRGDRAIVHVNGQRGNRRTGIAAVSDSGLLAFGLYLSMLVASFCDPSNNIW